MLDLTSLVAHRARYRPDRTALVFEGERLTWREFGARRREATLHTCCKYDHSRGKHSSKAQRTAKGSSFWGNLGITRKRPRALPAARACP
jgi:hypothetical protein